MIEVRLGTNWYVLRIILLELSRQNFLSPVTVPPKITVRELHCGLTVLLWDFKILFVRYPMICFYEWVYSISRKTISFFCQKAHHGCQ